MGYVRLGRRALRPGMRLKDTGTTRGYRVLAHTSPWGYRLEPDGEHPYEFMRSWPKVGRLKVLEDPTNADPTS